MKLGLAIGEGAGAGSLTQSRRAAGAQGTFTIPEVKATVERKLRVDRKELKDRKSGPSMLEVMATAGLTAEHTEGQGIARGTQVATANVASATLRCQTKS